jgi:hypothetical protein
MPAFKFAVSQAVYLQLVNLYDTPCKIAKCTQCVKAKLSSLHYTNEKSIPFVTYTSLMKSCFMMILKKDEDEHLSDQGKVEYLVKGIKIKHPHI